MTHFGEEPPVAFKKGSGTIFFTGCSLRCSFCQNMQISQNPVKKKYYSTEDFFSIVRDLVEKGAENINFVTPDHFLPHVIEAVKYMKKNNLNIPTVYNCSGYQSLESLKKVVDYIDVFLIDYKFSDKDAAKYCINTPDYPEICKKALEYLYKIKGNLKLDENGKASSGVLIRHLVMPDFIQNSLDVINDIFFDFGVESYISVMSQYSQAFLKNGLERINRRLTFEEYKRVTDLVEGLGFKNGYIQEYIDCDDEYLPDFNQKNTFKQEGGR